MTRTQGRWFCLTRWGDPARTCQAHAAIRDLPACDTYAKARCGVELEEIVALIVHGAIRERKHPRAAVSAYDRRSFVISPNMAA